MSGLSSLIAYDDDDEDEEDEAKDEDDEKRPHQSTQRSEAATSDGRAASSSSASSSSASSSPVPPTSSPVPALDGLSVLAAQLPPVDPPPSPSAVSSFLQQFPAHLSSLLAKKRSLPPSTPSLYAQLLALPNFHNPYIFPRLLQRYGVDEHSTLHARPPLPDSLSSISAEAEAEAAARVEREEEAEAARIRALREREEEEERARAAAVGRSSLAPAPPMKRPHEERVGASAASTAPLSADMEAKRQEALRRVQEITKRLRL